MIYGSVCSGIEAATVAWHPLGWEPAFFSEIEKFPCAVLQHHYPSVPNLGDMTKFKEWPDANIDVLVGGTPCQSFSVAGLRKGLDDPRGNLTLVFLAIVERYRPEWVVWENVPGVLSDKSNAFGQFLAGLAECGYGYAYRVLDAQFAGVPQRRRRVFVVGHLGTWQPAAAVLFERHSLQGHTAPSRKKGQDVAGTVTARTSGGGGFGTDFEAAGGLQPVSFDMRGNGDGDTINCLTGDHASRPTDYTPIVCMAHGQAGAEVVRDGSPSLTCNHEAPIVFDCKASGRNGFGVGDVSPTLRSMGHAGSHQNAGGQVAICFKGGQGSKARSLGLAEEQAPTLGAAQSGSQLAPVVAFTQEETPKSSNDLSHSLDAQNARRESVCVGMQVRRLTPRECERLQGFPDDYTNIPWKIYQECQRKRWNYEAELIKRGLTLKNCSTFDCPDGPRYKALGNSMAVPVMHWIGARIERVQRIIS